MEFWLIIIISISISILLKLTINHLSTTTTNKLPPGPTTFPIIGNIIWLTKSFSQLEPILRSLHSKFGPMVTLHIGSHPAIFIKDRSLAYQALIQKGAIFADRPPALPTTKIITCNQHNISFGSYGPTWRILRRNLTSEILNPTRVKSYSHARRWVLDILLDTLKSKSTTPVHVVDHLQYAMFCLLVLMCFGDKLEEKQIKEIEKVQRNFLLNFQKFNVLNFWPRVTKIVMHRSWQELYQILRDQENVLLPHIRARMKMKQDKSIDSVVLSYVDTLLDIELPEDKRKLNEGEIVKLCSEFLDTGTDTTSTALQWIIANLVKYPQIQERLFIEINSIMADKEEKDEVKEEYLQKMPYVKAVILEGLRRHPPAHFVLPHKVTEDVVLNGYRLPENGTVNFMVAEMGWDPKVWENPMEFKPERFLNNEEVVFDITGSREIKMMPFGAGRRICPGYGLAMLHLEYFVTNLVWNLKFNAVDGDEVSLEEEQKFTVAMKYPLQAHIVPRS
ncbi:hypothetical protein ACFE04_006842 [Oxalis oulophora]